MKPPLAALDIEKMTQEIEKFLASESKNIFSENPSTQNIPKWLWYGNMETFLAVNNFSSVSNKLHSTTLINHNNSELNLGVLSESLKVSSSTIEFHVDKMTINSRDKDSSIKSKFFFVQLN